MLEVVLDSQACGAGCPNVDKAIQHWAPEGAGRAAGVKGEQRRLYASRMGSEVKQSIETLAEACALPPNAHKV